MFSALTFNMQNGENWDEGNPGAVDLNATVSFLRAQNADLIFLQEVERGFEGGAQIQPPPNYEYLRAQLADYHSVFGYPLPNPLELPFGLGLAIFSKSPLDRFFRLDLPPGDVAFEFGGVKRHPSHRLLIGAETQIEGRRLNLLNTHLQAFFMISASSDTYCSQRNIVESRLRHENDATLLAGDFNCAPGETLINQFISAGFTPSQTEAVTWRRKPFVVDHIFYNKYLRLERCEVIPTLCSDHHAVRSEFSFIE
jgi:endonuclease/exonuclease/phosphatase family metal-dependent hydrolase